MRRRPEAYGLHPDGAPHPETVLDRQVKAPSSADTSSQDFTPQQALRTRAFWFLSLGHALAVTVVSAVVVHLMVYLNEGLGYSIQTAAALFAVITGFTLTGQLIGGVIGDRFSKHLNATGTMVGHANGLLALASATSLP